MIKITLEIDVNSDRIPKTRENCEKFVRAAMNDTKELWVEEVNYENAAAFLSFWFDSGSYTELGKIPDPHKTMVNIKARAFSESDGH